MITVALGGAAATALAQGDATPSPPAQLLLVFNYCFALPSGKTVWMGERE